MNQFESQVYYSMDFSFIIWQTQTVLKLIGESLLKKFYLSYSEKCPSEHNCNIPFRTQYSNIKLQLRNKGAPLQLHSSKTYPYPKGKNNGAKCPKYASP